MHRLIGGPPPALSQRAPGRRLSEWRRSLMMNRCMSALRQQKETPVATVGTRAPDFSLPATRGSLGSRRAAALSDYRDRWLVLMFYPRDFSLVCPTELTAVSARMAEFRGRDCDVLGVSTDSLDTHEQWIGLPRSQGGLGGLDFPLASDEDGSVCTAYGVYVPRQHLALRGLFIIDPNGVLQYQLVHNLSVGRRSEEVLRVLDGLQSGGLCPENWTPEQARIDPTQALGPRSMLGHFRIEAKIGDGTFGTVFRATDLTLERTVALKVIKPGSLTSPEAVLAEARAAAALNHPHVCTVYSVDGADGVWMIAMEHVEGQPLSRLLERGPMPPEQAAGVGRQIASGMAAAHEAGVVHGDLKPANIMVTPETVKIMDFGLARRASRAASTAETVAWRPDEAGGISGTPSYMSPEQARGEAPSAASDVFSLGLVLYEMVAGRRAVAGKHVLQVLHGIETLDADRLAADVPPPFPGILRKALVLEAEHRTAGMHEIAELLSSSPP